MTCKRSPLFTSQQRSLSYSIALSAHAYRGAPSPRSNFVYAYPRRHYSTPVPPTEKNSTADGALPVAPRSKKPKVELHPAPVRPKSASGSSQPKIDVPTAESSKAASGSSAPAGSEGIITQTKEDLEAAAQHGILKPPPEDAGRIMKLFHQAKELFVCALHCLQRHLMNLRPEILRERAQTDLYEPQTRKRDAGAC